MSGADHISQVEFASEMFNKNLSFLLFREKIMLYPSRGTSIKLC